MPQRKPLIGITASFDENYYKLYYAYNALIKEAGGIPVILPYEFDDMDILDGLIISGGGDMNPEFAGYEPSPLLELATVERDRAEMRLFHAAFAAKKPILGICRGHQVSNVCLGGTLIRDLPEAGYTEAHNDKDNYHPAYTEPGSLLRQMFGETTALWTTHHQGILQPGEGLRVAMRSPEGVIEGIEHESGLALGIQSHPERMGKIEPFEWLVGLARR